MTSLRFAVVAVVLLAASGVRADEGTRFRAELIGTEETPAISTPGSGTFGTCRGRRPRRTCTSAREASPAG